MLVCHAQIEKCSQLEVNSYLPRIPWQVVGSLPWKGSLPVYKQVYQEQVVAWETTQNIVEIPTVQEQVIVQEI